MDFIHEEKRDLKTVWNMFRKRKFEGTAGQAVKNSSFQLAQNLIFKIGSLLFTIIIARMLLPDLMGLYSLALSTIVLFGVFSDLGVGSAVITFISKKLGKNDPKKAKGYLKKLFKWKLYLVFIASGILLASAYFISEVYYAKPIFYALLVGGIYLPVVSLLGFVEGIFKASNDFKSPMIKEVIFQLVRLTLVPLAIFFLLKMALEDKTLIAFILLSLVICYSITFLFLIIRAKRKINFLKSHEKNVNEKESKELKRFILPLTATALSGVFFGYIDILMLGHFVDSNFIAFYGAAFALIGGATAIIGFAAVALLPIFARKTGKSLENIFKKTRNFTLLISILAGIFTYFVAYYLIRIAYGVPYLEAVPILKYFSILLVFLPLAGIYNTYLISQKKTNIIAWLLVGTTIINIGLNYFGITYGLRFGMMGAIYGAVGATILSRGIYLLGVLIFRRK